MAARIALTFSALFALVAGALAGPYADLQRSLDSAKTAQERSRIIQASPLAEQLKDLIQRDAQPARPGSDDEDQPADPDVQVQEAVAVRASAESAAAPRDLKALAAEVKESPAYTDRGERESTNWLYRAIQRLRNIHLDLPKGHGADMPTGIIGPWIIYVAWILLGSAVLVFLFIGLRRINFAALRKGRKRAGVLEEDDPDRTLDEWLILADQLESEGRYREAVRSLYLACLLKIDDARIARFDRGQTNWEHLARIESSPRRPPGLDFRKPTQAFDRIWYGYQVQGAEDVARFRQWYRDIVESTRKVAA